MRGSSWRLIAGANGCGKSTFTILFDNSTEEGYKLVAVLSSSEKLWFEPIPAWAAAVR
jgi:predicted ABC-type ATPase